MMLFIDGVFQKDESSLNIPQRAWMYGDGCFETIRISQNRIEFLEAHFIRLLKSAAYLKLDIPEQWASFEQFKQCICDTISALDFVSQNVYILRLSLLRGGGRGYLNNLKAIKESHWIIQISPFSASFDPEFKLAISDRPRIPSACLPASIKHCNGLYYTLIGDEAMLKRADDILTFTLKGKLSESSSANIFFIKDQVLYTPSLDCDVLDGIIRKTIIDLCKKHHIIVSEGVFNLDDLLEAEAVFLTNSVRHIIRVKTIQSTLFDTEHPLFQKMNNLLKESVLNHSVNLNA